MARVSSKWTAGGVRTVRPLLVWLLVSIGLGPFAQDLPRIGAAEDRVTSETVERRLSEVAKELAELDGVTTPGEPGSRRIADLRELESTLRRIGPALERRDGALRELTELRDKDLPPGERVVEEPPYSFDKYLEALEEVKGLEREASALLLAVEKAEREAEDIRQRVLRTESEGRRLREELDESAPESVRSERAAALAATNSTLRSLQATADLREIQLETAVARAEATEIALNRARELSGYLAERIVFGRSAQRDRLADLSERIESLEESLSEARENLRTINNRLDAAQVAYDNASTEEELRERQAYLDYLKRLAEIETERIDVLEDRLELTAKEEPIWRRLQPLTAGNDRSDWNVWREEAVNYRDSIENTLRLLETQEAATRDRALELRETLASQDLGANEARWARSSLSRLEAHQQFLGDSILAIRRQNQLAEAFLATLDRKSQRITWTDRLNAIAASLAEVWNRELWHFNDRPITVRKVVSALILLIVGFLLSRWFARLLRNRILPRMGIRESGAAVFEKVINYGVLLLIFLLVLRVINIPITAFAFLGGAAAIAVGFGAQNVLNNFLSGIILLMERPIRVGDVIEIDQSVGIVEEIGGRSTRIRTFEGTFTYLPNSFLLENKLINLTMRNKMRCSVKVGVAYGSPTRRVADIMEECADRHGLILNSPEPRVLFQDFGDNSLNFEVIFWVALDGQSDFRLIRSDIRHMIAKRFTEAGIVIAFPQRDVHLDTLSPLHVRMLGPGEEPRAKRTGENLG